MSIDWGSMEAGIISGCLSLRWFEQSDNILIGWLATRILIKSSLIESIVLRPKTIGLDWVIKFSIASLWRIALVPAPIINTSLPCIKFNGDQLPLGLDL